MKIAVPAGARRVGWLVLSLLVLAGLSQALWAGDNDDDDSGAGVKFTAEAATTFNSRCTACHTYGKGIKVGPDLKGVNDRRKRDWLLKFVHASSEVIKSGDPTATALFAQFKQQRMPDWVDLSDKQIGDILDYIAVGGPDIKPADERNAATGTSADIENGRKLFYGETPIKYGAQACINCHGVRGSGLRGGSLGPDLSNAYLRYQDLALTQFLRHPCFGWRLHAPVGRYYLTPKESFAVKVFLRSVVTPQSGQSSSSGNNVPPQKEGGSNGK